MIKSLFLILFWGSIYITVSAQNPQLSSAQIYEELEKFNFLGTALYVAAHPDDENTRLISYLSNGIHARTAYLSLTRGDGGQNLIGTEIQDLLGVLRSQELQMARATDGGQQFFSRAKDFGFSKNPSETLVIWDKEKVLEDVLHVIRTFKPDIIINRFDHRTPGKTHGHHTSSAMLSVEAFDLAGDPSAYPEQAKKIGTWQPHRQFMNTSWWFYGSRENFEKADKTNLISVDAGPYYPILGISNGEIAAQARSKHRSQGFGSGGGRGSYQEFLEVINGDIPADKDNMFDGVNTTWTRVKGGSDIQSMMDEVFSSYDFKNPVSIVPQLLEVYDAVNNLEDEHWREIKLDHLKEIILSCYGIYAEVSTDTQTTTHGDSLEVQIEITNRSPLTIQINQLELNGTDKNIKEAIEANTESKWFKSIFINKNISYSNPYWLDQRASLGMFKVDDPHLRNLPQSPAALTAEISLNIGSRKINIERDVIYKYVNPAEGEIKQPLAVIPAATLSFSKEIYLFANSDSEKIEVKVRAGKDDVQGTLKLIVPTGWSINPKSVEIDIPNKLQEKSFSFVLTPPEDKSNAFISATCTIDGVINDKSLINIDYDHIPLQTILKPAESVIVRVPLNKGGKNIAYVMGAGDKIPESLTGVGYNVTLLEATDLPNLDLDKYNAIVIGIRAYNTLESLKLYNQHLFDYAHRGGTVITQYNTSRRLNFDDLAPYPIKLFRGRVTDENAEMRILQPDHKVLNYPNKITSEDFEGWVQERGLYFAEEWAPEYKAIFSCYDKDEDPLDGSMLIAEHGDGYFVYTSLSWFRELPAGVPGAYRIFANMLALSDSNKP
jgi:LmbE family N-acetylglucosaminyl deacetylase